MRNSLKRGPNSVLRYRFSQWLVNQFLWRSAPIYQSTGVELFVMSKVQWSVWFVFKFTLPPFSTPLPSVVQFSKQNTHWTFDIINNSTPAQGGTNFAILLSPLSPPPSHARPQHVVFSLNVFEFGALDILLSAVCHRIENKVWSRGIQSGRFPLGPFGNQSASGSLGRFFRKRSKVSESRYLSYFWYEAPLCPKWPKYVHWYMASILGPLDPFLTLWNLSRKNRLRLPELPDCKPNQVEIAQTGLPPVEVDIPWFAVGYPQSGKNRTTYPGTTLWVSSFSLSVSPSTTAERRKVARVHKNCCLYSQSLVFRAIPSLFVRSTTTRTIAIYSFSQPVLSFHLW